MKAIWKIPVLNLIHHLCHIFRNMIISYLYSLLNVEDNKNLQYENDLSKIILNFLLDILVLLEVKWKKEFGIQLWNFFNGVTLLTNVANQLKKKYSDITLFSDNSLSNCQLFYPKKFSLYPYYNVSSVLGQLINIIWFFSVIRILYLFGNWCHIYFRPFYLFIFPFLVSLFYFSSLHLWFLGIFILLIKIFNFTSFFLIFLVLFHFRRFF